MRRCILPYPTRGAKGKGALALSPWPGRGLLAWEGRFGRHNERARRVVSPFQGFFRIWMDQVPRAALRG